MWTPLDKPTSEQHKKIYHPNPDEKEHAANQTGNRIRTVRVLQVTRTRNAISQRVIENAKECMPIFHRLCKNASSSKRQRNVGTALQSCYILEVYKKNPENVFGV